MHQLQRGILKKLSQKKGLRFSEIKPRGVESNHFMYHLKEVLKEGWVKKTGLLYSLTAKGKQLTDRMSMEKFEERIQPKIVTLVVIKKDNAYLLYRRGRQPFLGKIGFPYGKIHLGERVEEAAHRELKEKTGLTAASLTYRGDVYISVHDEEDLITHMLCHVFSGEEVRGALTTDSSIGECFWAPLSIVAPGERIPGVTQVEKLLLRSDRPFFQEYFLDIHEE